MTSLHRVWRSMLFLPAHVEKYIESAHTRSADAYILDLEDSVPEAEKPRARAALERGLPAVTRKGAAALVRINSAPGVAQADIGAACVPGLSALVLPKVQRIEDVQRAADHLNRFEAERGMPVGAIGLIAQIESVDALPVLDDIATSSSRLLGMILGSEDFSLSAGMEPLPEFLVAPNQLIVFACRRAHIWPLGFPASIADYSDLAGFRTHVRRARQMGFVGAFCVHPTQVAILNEEFLPSAAEIDEALKVIDAFKSAVREGRSSFSYRGRMIDPPVVARANEILWRAGTPTQYSATLRPNRV